MDMGKALIKEIKKQNCIFDLCSPNYKTAIQKDQLWEKIGKSLDLSGDTCRKKWKGLWNKYRRIKRSRMLASDRAAPSHRIKSWRLYDSMEYLVRSSRRTTGNVSKAGEAHCDIPPLFDASTPKISQPATPTTSLPVPISADSLTYVTLGYQRQLQDFCGVLVQLEASLKQVADILQSKKETPTELWFAALAQMLNAYNMPESVLQSVLCKVRTVVFNAIQNGNIHGNIHG